MCLCKLHLCVHSGRKSLRPLIIALLLILCGTVIGISFAIDRPVREHVLRGQGKSWKKSPDHRLHAAVRKYGDWPWLMLGGAIGVGLCWRNRRWQRILVAAMLASTLAGIAANALRLTTGRTRPRASPEVAQGFYGPYHDGRILVGDSNFNSFPSGHTATAFGFAWVIVLASPLFGILALAAASAIAWSSIAMGAHHPSDVTLSILLSLPVAWLTWRFVRVRGDAVLAKCVSFFKKQTP